jgi:hypothetical protein
MDQYNPEGGPVRLARKSAPDRLQCVFQGEIDEAALREAAQRVRDALTSQNAPGAVELDLRASRTRYAFSDLIVAAEQVLAAVRPGRIALIGEPGHTDTHLMVLETVTFPHGTRVRRFSDPAAAADWLAQPDRGAPQDR